MGKKAKEYETMDEVIADFSEHFEPDTDQEELKYWTANIGWSGRITIGEKYVFSSYGEAKGKALEYLVEYIQRLKTRKVKSKESVEKKNFIQYLVGLDYNEIVDLRDKLLAEDILTIEEHTY